MKIRFCIEYFTLEQQQLYIVFSNQQRQAMIGGGNGIWSIEYELKTDLTYHYELCSPSNELLRKEDFEHSIPGLEHDTTIYDRWWDKPIEQPF